MAILAGNLNGELGGTKKNGHVIFKGVKEISRNLMHTPHGKW
jgi:hypothetical protein